MQEVNLLSAELTPHKDPFTLREFCLAWGLLTILLVALTAWQAYEVSQIEQNLAADKAALAVSRAKAYCAEAFAQAGITGVQLHGGVGYTWEYDIQLYLKRAKWVRPMFGDADTHYERIARLGGL